MPSALILGASRGLGLGLAGELVRRDWAVTATVRKAADQAAVEAVGATSALADITDAASLGALDATTPPGFDLLFVNAGISEPADLESIDAAGVGHLFLTNAVAPVRAARALLGRLAEGGMIAFMSSRMGSVALTEADNKAMYRASKAALNSLTRGFAATIGSKHPVLTLHPGWVATDMGGAGADLDVATSVRGLADVIEARRGRPGSVFLDYAGHELAW
jgi:NAD(P)-dependent dehydrogenase (short-subunit alcohol dehydrogenase family)